jgi:hypothetical protein
LRRKKKASSSSYTEKVLPASQSELRRKTTSEERNTSTPATTLPLLSKNFCVSIRQESRKNWKKARHVHHERAKARANDLLSNHLCGQ